MQDEQEMSQPIYHQVALEVASFLLLCTIIYSWERFWFGNIQ